MRCFLAYNLYFLRYFEEDDDANDGAYQPAPGSPGPQINSKTSSSSEEDDDPLDAFMAGIEQEVGTRLKSYNLNFMGCFPLFFLDFAIRS